MHSFELVGEEAARKIIGGEQKPISRVTLWRGVKSGRYPLPIRVGLQSCRWRTDELYEFLERASAARAVAE